MISKGQIFFWIVAWILQIVLVGVIVPSDFIERQIDQEHEMIQDWLGVDTSDSLWLSSNERFKTVFRDTGMIDASYTILPSYTQRANSTGLETLGDSMWPYVQSRIEVMWLTIYQAVQRFGVIALWAPYFLPILIPSLIHGYTVREIKKVSYGYASPVIYHAAGKTLIAALFLPLFYITLPIAIHPMLVMIWGVCVSLLMLALSANVQKQI